MGNYWHQQMGGMCGELLPELLNEAGVAKWNEVNDQLLQAVLKLLNGGMRMAEVRSRAHDRNEATAST